MDGLELFQYAMSSGTESPETKSSWDESSRIDMTLVNNSDPFSFHESCACNIHYLIKEPLVTFDIPMFNVDYPYTNETGDIKNNVITIEKFSHKKAKTTKYYTNKCSICLYKFNNKSIMKLNCDHIYHKKCIKKWLKKNNSCPLCRSKQ